MKLLVLVFVIMAQSSWVTMEVVNSFTTCSDFFIKDPNTNQSITPTVLSGDQYKTICQFYKGLYQYATLFDTKNRIPVYSANVLRTTNEMPRPKAEWKNEPGLDNLTGREMTDYATSVLEKLMNQAVNEDYKESNYTRGHVFPNKYANNKDQALSTFTFTNIAPQTKDNNEQWDKKVETPMHNKIIKNCKFNNTYEVYIVTGVIPGDKWIPIKRTKKSTSKVIQKGINIVKYYWTTYCCKVGNVMKSSAYMARHYEQEIYAFDLPVKSLNRELTTKYLPNNNKEEFKVFGDLCLD